MKIDFYLRFHTQFGQTLAIAGNLPSLGNDDLNQALPMNFFNNEFWHASIELDPAGIDSFQYRYIFINEKGNPKKEAEKDRQIDLKKLQGDVVAIDTWNDEASIENAFLTAPFTQVFFREHKKVKHKKHESFFSFPLIALRNH